ncbi:hypothetical protein FOMPIDRAFT_100321 [Fomitopsis schrenkii]|uniref:Uncharacterized protein n=1 Tax=Fomitopsis schrenkii TaxID=2126942 RepID=S8E7T2_FOMSC|nr:hypothetical protein FOMPIDRAFT_100321 [Fomitopsis schrenkii]
MRLTTKSPDRNSYRYELLPAAEHGVKPVAGRKTYSYRRCLRLVAVAASALATIALIARSYRSAQPVDPFPDPATLPPELLPPLYGRFHEAELRLPQHHPDYPLAAGRKYFHYNNSVLYSGWGNAMQELLLLHYLSYRAGRSFVFDNYTWSDNSGPWAYNKDTVVPSHIPLSALIQGPTVGAPIPTDPYAPLAVIRDHFQKECPNPTLISRDEVTDHLGGTATAGQIIDAWAEKLRSIDDPCVEVPRMADSSIFDIFVFGEANRLLDVWPEFSESPILSQFGWSPLIELAFDTNRETISPATSFEPPLYTIPFTSNRERYTPLPGLLALHIRRGDFEEHCQLLARYNSTYTAYNAFPGLPDRLDTPLSGEEAERMNAYRPHCFPDISEIVAKADEVRESEAGRGLRRMFVMTNGDAKWVERLKQALATSGWEAVASSRDVVVNKEQKYVEQAVDMLIGQRAQAFVGNGFSSLTGQIVMLRTANGFPMDSSRFF